MRKTVRIDDDVLRAAKSIAASQDRSLGEVLSELARRGLEPRQPRRAGAAGGPGVIPVFDVDMHAAPLTPEMVREALDNGA